MVTGRGIRIPLAFNLQLYPSNEWMHDQINENIDRCVFPRDAYCHKLLRP